MTPADRTLPEFVGRSAELDRLRAALAASASGPGRVVLVSGAAGMGKTTLCGRLSHFDGDTIVLWGRSSESEGAPPFWPWIQVLRQAVQILAARQVRLDLFPGAGELVRLVPALRTVCSLDAAWAGEGAPSRFRLFDGVSVLLGLLASVAPVVVIVDDLHAADASSLQLLRFLTHHGRQARVTLIGTFLESERRLDHPLDAAIAEILRAPDIDQIRLTGLSRDEVGEFLTRALGGWPPPRLVTALHRRTEGTPLFVAEFVRDLMAHPRAITDDSAENLELPDNLRMVFRQRLAAVAPDSLQIVQAVAAMGMDVQHRVLERLAPASQVARALRDGIAAGLLGSRPDPGHALGFVHPLMREAAYKELAPEARARLHWHIGEAMEDVLPAVDVADELARHFAMADCLPGFEKSVRYARLAASQALGMAAFERAREMYRMALDGMAQLPWAAPEDRTDMLLEVGRIENIIGQREQARETFRQAAALARRGLPAFEAAVRLARAATGFAGDWMGVNEVVEPGNPLSFSSEAYALLEEALEALGDRDTPERAWVAGRLAVEMFFRDPPEARGRLADGALDLARRLGDPFTLAVSLFFHHMATWTADNAEARVDRCNQLVEAAVAANDADLEASGFGLRVVALLELGLGDEARRSQGAFAAAASRSRHPFVLWAFGVQQGMWAMLEGRFSEAEQAILEAFAHGKRGRATPLVHLGLQMAALQRELGRHGDLAMRSQLLRIIADQNPTILDLRIEAAFLQAEVGDLEAARADFEHLARHGFADPARQPTLVHGLAQLAEVCVGLADEHRAPILYELLRPFADRYDVGLGATSCGGSIHRYLGMLATLQRRFDLAAAHFETATQANQLLGARPALARTQVAHAAMLQARGGPGDLDRARYLARMALTVADFTGMTTLGGVARAILASAGPADASPESLPSAVAREPFLWNDGDYWTLGYEGRTIRLRATRGLHYLAHLLREPGREMLAFDLLAAAGSPEASESGRPARNVELGPRLDARAVASYRERMAELREELSEARRVNDLGRCDRLQAELEIIGDSLRTAFGLGHRRRLSGSDSERARVTVTKRIRDVIRKLDAIHPELAHHLRASVRTGMVCSYTPGPRAARAWHVELEPSRS